MQLTEFKIKKVLIVGCGKTGIALAKLFAHIGSEVTINDFQSEEQLAPQLEELKGITFRGAFGAHRTEVFLDQDFIFASPGVPLQQEAFNMARQKGIPISNDLELAFSLTKAPFIAVSGTNGKTTVTSLIGEIFQEAGKKVIIGGNIGTPLSPIVYAKPDIEYVIAEVSSFQLEVIQKFRPWIGIMLNITPDHLDRYAQFEDYLKAKARLLINQRVGDFAVVNIQDAVTSRFLSLNEGAGKVLYFNIDAPVSQGVTMEGKDIIARIENRDQLICTIDKSKLIGDHNRQNIVAAATAAWLAGIKGGIIQHTIENFSGLSHRLEFVTKINNVHFINDSKGTNVGAVIKAIESIKGPIWLILGGKDKGNDYLPLIAITGNHIKGILAIGESRDKIDKNFQNKVPVYKTNSLQEAVNLGYSMARPEDVVLLSPGCASFDMFNNYAHRGQVFKEIIQDLGNAQKTKL